MPPPEIKRPTPLVTANLDLACAAVCQPDSVLVEMRGGQAAGQYEFVISGVGPEFELLYLRGAVMVDACRLAQTRRALLTAVKRGPRRV